LARNKGDVIIALREYLLAFALVHEQATSFHFEDRTLESAAEIVGPLCDGVELDLIENFERDADI
jgi:hypothetical protein